MHTGMYYVLLYILAGKESMEGCPIKINWKLIPAPVGKLQQLICRLATVSSGAKSRLRSRALADLTALAAETVRYSRKMNAF